MGEFPTSGHCGIKVYSRCFGPSAFTSPVCDSLQKDCIKQTEIVHLLPATLKHRGVKSRPGSVFIRPVVPPFIRSFPFPPSCKDTAKATAIVFKLFILSQDCVVIYNVNTENTL